MKKFGKADYNPIVNIKKMEGVPVDCVYVKTEMFQPKDPAEEKTPLHTFHEINNSDKEFVVFGFGLLNYHIMGKEGDEDAPAMKAGQHVRLVYKGKKQKTTTTASGKKINNALHDIDLFDITDEVKSGKIKETTMDLVLS